MYKTHKSDSRTGGTSVSVRALTRLLVSTDPDSTLRLNQEQDINVSSSFLSGTHGAGTHASWVPNKPEDRRLHALEDSGSEAKWTEWAEWELASQAVHSLRTTSFRYSFVKPMFDSLFTLALLPILLPLCLLIAVLIRLDSPGPILYRHIRIGRFGRRFSMWKFRSMHTDGDAILAEHLRTNSAAQKEWQEQHKLQDDPRITRIGKFLRRSSLDELPQFLNVLRGDMSLVGPRPIVPAEAQKYRVAYFFYLSALPGMSGLWQISGRSNLDYEQRVKLDLKYVTTWSLIRDLRILWQTLGTVLQAHGAV